MAASANIDISSLEGETSMKKLYFLFILILMISLCACQEEQSLTVYTVKDDALYTAAVAGYQKDHPDVTLNVVPFASYEELNERMTTELLGGKGPDVLLFNSLYSTTDYYKFSQSGVFLPLDSYMTALQDGSRYYTKLLDAGKIGDQQYVLPMSWNLLQIYATQDVVQQHGYEDVSIYDALLTEADRLTEEELYASASLALMRADPLNLFLENAGIPVVDIEKGTFVADKEKQAETAAVVKSFFDNLQKTQAINSAFRNDFAGAVSHFTFLIENYPFMHNLRFYQTLYPSYMQQQMYAAYFPQLEGDGLSAQIIHYGGINANTQNADGAWDLLQYILNAPVSTDFSKYDMSGLYYSPVTVAEYENCVVQLESQSGQGPVRIDPLDPQNAAFLRSVPGMISEAYVPNPVLGGLVDGCMMDYLTGTASFDDCYTKLENQIRCYLQE